MKIHELKVKSNYRGKKRIGRGGKRGTTSGRGTKGQKSRAGRKMRPAVRDLIIRIPKRRGFRNKPTSVKPRILSLTELVKMIKPLAAGNATVAVNNDVLHRLGAIPKHFHGKVKVLGKGEVPFAIVLSGIAASRGAIVAIEKAGGSVTS